MKLQTIRTLVVGIFTFSLVRICTSRDLRRTAPQERTWKWQIRAEARGRVPTYVFAPNHWRETKGEESPHRPFDSFSAICSQEIDPVRSGWVALCGGCGSLVKPNLLSNRDRHGFLCGGCDDSYSDWQADQFHSLPYASDDF